MEIHLSYVDDQTHKITKCVYNEKRALLEQGCHQDNCNRNSAISVGSLEVRIHGKYR